MKLLKLIGQIVGAITAVGVIGGAAIYAYQFQERQNKVLETVEYINVEQSFMANDIMQIKDSLKDITDHQVKQDQHMRDMENAARFYIHNQAEMTENAMEEALEMLLKKNNGLTVSTDAEETASGGSSSNTN